MLVCPLKYQSISSRDCLLERPETVVSWRDCGCNDVVLYYQLYRAGEGEHNIGLRNLNWNLCKERRALLVSQTFTIHQIITTRQDQQNCYTVTETGIRNLLEHQQWVIT